MNIVLIHNYYNTPGGEDKVFATESALLKTWGHKIFTYTFHNKTLENIHIFKQAVHAIWNHEAYLKIRKTIRTFKPHVVHIHNTFPLASPAVAHAAKAEGVPVVYTLHNYRLLCVNALLFREGQVCEDCLGHLPWRGALRGCYRESRAMSSVVATMLTTHRVLGTWTRIIDTYIALTEFSRGKFIEGGIPAEKIVVKPNFIHPDPGAGEGDGMYALFVGRLSEEKGIETLLAAWELSKPKIPLKIVGEGPLNSLVAKAANQENIQWLKRRSSKEVLKLMQRATFLILPSIVYENFPMTIAEAYATGLPVLASNLGAMASLVDHGRTGLLFHPGDASDLAQKIQWSLGHPQKLRDMRKEARREYEMKYTAEYNYKLLMQIYKQTIEGATI